MLPNFPIPCRSGITIRNISVIWLSRYYWVGWDCMKFTAACTNCRLELSASHWELLSANIMIFNLTWDYWSSTFNNSTQTSTLILYYCSKILSISSGIHCICSSVSHWVAVLLYYSLGVLHQTLAHLLRVLRLLSHLSVHIYCAVHGLELKWHFFIWA